MAIDLFEQSCDISFGLFQRRKLLLNPRENCQLDWHGTSRSGQPDRLTKKPFDTVTVVGFAMSTREENAIFETIRRQPDPSTTTGRNTTALLEQDRNLYPTFQGQASRKAISFGQR